MFTIQEAAEELGISVSTIKWHIYRRPDETGEPPLLQGEIKGNTMIFTQEDLDEFRSKVARPGRKTKYDPPPVVTETGRYQCPACGKLYSRQWFGTHIADCEDYIQLKYNLEHENED